MAEKVHLTPSRWLVLAAACTCELAAGSAYAFGIFSNYLRDGPLGFSQSQVSNIATAGNIGLYLSVLGGLFYGRFGPQKTLIFGGLISSCGTFCLWLAATGRIKNSTIWAVALFNLISQFGCTWMMASGITIAIQSFPAQDKGKVIGLTKGLFGLSSSMMAELYVGLLSPMESKFIFLIAVLVPSVAFICSLVTVNLPPSMSMTYRYDRFKSPSFLPWALVSLSLAICLLIAAIVQNVILCSGNTSTDCIPSTAPRISFLVCSIFLLGLFLVLPMRYGPLFVSTDAAEMDRSRLGNTDDTVPLIGSEEAADFPLQRTLLTLNFWLLFGTFALGSGCGVLVINNITQIAQAVAGPGGSYLPEKNAMVAVLGFASFIGRVSIGGLSDRFQRTHSRAPFMLLCLLIMGITHLTLAIAQPSFGVLFAACALVGYSHGGMFSCCASMMSDLYGRLHFAANYGALDLAPSVGSIVLASQIVAAVYNHAENGDGKCYGKACFQMSFAIAACCCALGGVSGLILWRRLTKTI